MDSVVVNDLRFKYGTNEVLKNINFTLQQGDIVGLVGENGVGKTTLMKIISGILPGYKGKLNVIASSIGVLIEEPSLYKDLSVIKNLEFYCKLYDKPYSEIDRFKTILKTDSYMQKKVSSLSLGMKQRIGLFVALIASTELILLDEPTNGLDPKGIVELLELIKKLSLEYKITFIISSHILSNLDEICNKYMILRNKTIEFIDTEKSKYKILAYDISQKDLIERLEINDFKFDKKGNDVIVHNIQEVENYLINNGIIYSKEVVKLSEVYFNEK